LKYVSLHHHSTFSYMDAYGTPAQHVARAVELGMTALALTEHGNVSSHVGLEKAALKAGIKPIFGLEAYTALEPKSDRKCHLTLLAMDQDGYANLMRLCTRSWAEGFHKWPTVLGPMLRDHHEGLIVLSGCSDSLLACSLLGGKMIDPKDASEARAIDLAGRMKDLLGDRFYLECQVFPELDRSVEINETYEALGEQLDIQLVATSDVHTLLPGQSEMRALLHAAGRGTNSIAQQLSSWEYDVPDYPPLSDTNVLDDDGAVVTEGIWERALRAGLSEDGARQALRSTGVIAGRCNVTLPKAARFRFAGTESDRRWNE